MSSSRTQKFTVEVEAGTDPIHGRVFTDAEVTLGFDGWLELVWALQRALSPATAPEPKNTNQEN